MNEPDAVQPTIESFADLPIQPTGSGVADLEIAYEQMKLADDAGLADDAPTAGMPDEPASMPTETGDDAIESAAHPS